MLKRGIIPKPVQKLHKLNISTVHLSHTYSFCVAK